MLGITLAVLFGIGLAAGTGQSAANQSSPASGSGIGKAVGPIGEIELRFRDAKVYSQYQDIHDYIEDTFDKIISDFNIETEDVSSNTDLAEPIFVIARIWLQPRRSFADLREMFRITLDCYDNMIEILTQSRTSGTKISPVETKFAKARMKAVRHHVDQVLDATEDDAKPVVVYHHKPRDRGHFDNNMTDEVAAGYKYVFTSFTFDMLENLVSELEDEENGRFLNELESLFKPQPPDSCILMHEGFTAVIERVKERLNSSALQPLSDIVLHSLSEEIITNLNRRLDEISVYVDAMPHIYDLANDVAQRKFILPERVAYTYANLWKLRAESGESSKESRTSKETALQDGSIRVTVPSLFTFQAITSLNPWQTCEFEI